MNEADFSIRRMNQHEVASVALEWAAREGWNPGLDDAAAFFAADPQGFFVGLLGGEPVASISAVAYDAVFGFIGLYIVHPGFRGRGFGRRVWEAALEYLGERNLGLDGVVERQAMYAASGFRFAYRNARYRGVGIPGVATPAPHLVDLAALPFAEVAAYDRPLFPAPRTAFLEAWIRPPHGRALGALGADGRLSGYGVIRACRTGCKIGPLCADDADTAEALFLALAAFAAGAPLFLDIPETNPAALALVQRFGMEQVFETARMYTRGEPALARARIFGVTTFELG